MTAKQLTWIISKRAYAKKALERISDPEARRLFKAKLAAKLNTRTFWNAESCYNYLRNLSGNPERVINYTIHYDGSFYVTVRWAAEHDLPYACYRHDGKTDWVELTPFGIMWLLDYMLHRNGKLVIRKLSGRVL